MMDLPKPRPQVMSIQAKLDSILRKSATKSTLGSKSKTKNLNQDLEEDVYGSDDFFSED